MTAMMMIKSITEILTILSALSLLTLLSMNFVTVILLAATYELLQFLLSRCDVDCLLHKNILDISQLCGGMLYLRKW